MKPDLEVIQERVKALSEPIDWSKPRGFSIDPNYAFRYYLVTADGWVACTAKRRA